jgi:thiosulfate dehydrogenase (quinone) large subunit
MKTKETLFALTRIALGWIFLWAFLDKTFGLGLATLKENAWINGGSPTTDFFTNAVAGPFADFFSSLAGVVWVDWVFMLGMFLVGIGLILGIAMRLSGFFGGVIMVLMYAATASLPLENNHFVDDHIINALILFAFAFSDTGETLGLGKRWKRTRFVRKFPLLR